MRVASEKTILIFNIYPHLLPALLATPDTSPFSTTFTFIPAL